MDKKWAEPMPWRVADHKTKIKNHTVFTHLGCAMLRITLALILIFTSPMEHPTIMTVLMITLSVVALGFAAKFVVQARNGAVTWKSYPKAVLAYGAALGLMYKGEAKLAGVVLIAEVLIGVQARHTAFALAST